MDPLSKGGSAADQTGQKPAGFSLNLTAENLKQKTEQNEQEALAKARANFRVQQLTSNSIVGGGKPKFDLTQSGFNNITKNDGERPVRPGGYGVAGITPMNESSRGFNQFMEKKGDMPGSSMISQSPLNAGKFSNRFR